MIQLFRSIGIAVRIVVLGEALFIALIAMFAMGSGAQVFRYAGF